MANVLSLAVIASLAAGLSFLTQKKIELTFIWVVFMIIIALYFFGLAGFLTVGWWLIIIISLVSLVFVCTTISKKKLRLILTPGFAFVIAFFVLSLVIHHRRYVVTFDEFNHWFNAVKNTYFLDRLFTAEQSNLLSKSYSPGSTLFHYFWMKFDRTYRESYIFISMNFFFATLFAPVLGHFSWKNKSAILRSTLLLFFVPLTIYSYIYTGAYVDGLMGVMAAYALFNYYIYRLKPIGLLSICLALFTLPLVKMSGAFLALIVVAILSIDYLRNYTETVLSHET